MATGGRSGVLVAALARRGFAWAPDWRAFLAGVLAREVEERRFFLWIPVAAMAGVALNFAADSEPVLWLPGLMAAAFAALAWVSRARPLARGLLVGAAALCAGFLSTSLRIARVETPMLDHIRIVKLQGFVEEVDFRPVGARLVLAVVDHGDMPADLAPRRVRVTTRKTPESPRATTSLCRRGCCRRRAPSCRAATTSPATPISPASAPSARRSAGSACCRRRPTRPGVSASARRSTMRAIAWR